MAKIKTKLYIFFFLILGDHGPPWSPLPPSLDVVLEYWNLSVGDFTILESLQPPLL
jgi:hypothetical protein